MSASLAEGNVPCVLTKTFVVPLERMKKPRVGRGCGKAVGLTNGCVSVYFSTMRKPMRPAPAL